MYLNAPSLCFRSLQAAPYLNLLGPPTHVFSSLLSSHSVDLLHLLFLPVQSITIVVTPT